MTECRSCRAALPPGSAAVRCRSCASMAGWSALTMSAQVARYCELCGRAHAGHWECVQRAERAAEDVRLWLYEGMEP